MLWKGRVNGVVMLDVDMVVVARGPLHSFTATGALGRIDGIMVWCLGFPLSASLLFTLQISHMLALLEQQIRLPPCYRIV